MTGTDDVSGAPLDIGKLPPELLGRLLGQIAGADPRVITGARVGEDAALIDIGGDTRLVVSSDPVTFAAEDLGRYAVHVNANDIAVMGATPRWLLMTLLLPEGAPPRLAQDIMRQTLDACAEINVTLVGGHTEVTRGLDRPITVGAMLGEVRSGEETPSSGARAGDAIILTRGVGIEGTAILAREAAGRLRAAGVPEAVIHRAASLLDDPGISIVRDAAIAAKTARVHAMHDPTEGGVATALHEMATASDVGAEIDAGALDELILPETAEICRAIGARPDDVDPLGLIASGALLAAVSPQDADRVIDALRADGIRARVIGRATPRGEGLRLTRRGSDGGVTEKRPLPRFDRDELARVLDGG